MEPIVRPASWNRRNRLMNRQGTVWNRSEPEPKPERSNQVPNRTGTEPAQLGPWPSLVMDSYKQKSTIFNN